MCKCHLNDPLIFARFLERISDFFFFFHFCFSNISCTLVYPLRFMVQNLSFLVIQMLTSHNFFSIWLIYRIFMGDREEMWNFLTPTKKKGKKGKKGLNFKFSKKVKILKKIIIFLKVYSLCTPFTFYILFCKK